MEKFLNLNIVQQKLRSYKYSMIKKILIILFLVFSPITACSTLNELNSISQKNIETIKGKEDALKKKEEEIKLKKNLLSQNELNQEIDKLKKNFINLRNEKDKLSSEFNKLKNDKMNLFFEKISPIVQEFMKKNNVIK